MIRISIYLVTLRNISSFALLLLIIACHSKSQQKQWNNASIDRAIANNNAYKQLDSEGEIFSFGDFGDTSMKRTSGVLYFTKGHVNLSDSNSARLNNCRAYFFQNGILTINIGIGNGFSDWGFGINYKDGRFHIEPYYSTDMVIPDQPQPIYEVVYQKLILDKRVYKVGDSLYGEVNFKCLEIDQDKKRIEHSGEGYFRTKVKNNNSTQQGAL